MNVLYFLVPIAFLLAGAGVLAFRWAVKSGQFDDLDSPAVSIFAEADESNTNQRRTERKQE